MQFDVPTVLWGGLYDGFSPEALVTLAFFVFFLGLAWRWGQNLLVAGIPFILMVLFTYLGEWLGFLSVFTSYILGNLLGLIGYLAGVLLGLLLGVLILRELGAAALSPAGEAEQKRPGKLEGELDRVIGRQMPTPVIVVSALVAGFVFSLVEMNSISCRGWPRPLVPLFYVGLYYLAFTIPLVLVLVSIYFVQKTSWWRALVDRHASTVRLVGGAGFVALALWLGWQGRYWLRYL